MALKIVLTPAADFALANLLLWHLAAEFILHEFPSKINLSFFLCRSAAERW
jgi:hypothetical protein